jgi:hypothetical protein
MGRLKIFRQRLGTQAASLEAKCLFNYLVSEIKIRREVSLEEAIIIARDVQQYLEQSLLRRAPGQIEFPAVEGRNNHRKRGWLDQPERLVKLTVVAEEDIELMSEFGTVALQRGRIARIIEESHCQDAILDGPRLSVLILETNRGLRQSLKHFWNQGVLLPVCGMRRENRTLMKAPRAVLALELYLAGGDLNRVRKNLCVSSSRWQQWWRDFKAVLRGEPWGYRGGIMGTPYRIIILGTDALAANILLRRGLQGVPASDGGMVFQVEGKVEIWAHCLMPNHVHLIAVGRPLGDEAFLTFLKKHWDGLRGHARADPKDPGRKRTE